MSATVLHIIGLVKSLPSAEQEAICAALVSHRAAVSGKTGRIFQRTADGRPYNPNGIPNDDPFFRIIEEDEAARRADFGPPAPVFD